MNKQINSLRLPEENRVSFRKHCDDFKSQSWLWRSTAFQYPFVTEPKAKLILLLSLKQHLTLAAARTPVVELLYPWARTYCDWEHLRKWCKDYWGGGGGGAVPPYSPPPRFLRPGHHPSCDVRSAGPPGCSDRPRSHMTGSPPCRGLQGPGGHFINPYFTQHIPGVTLLPSSLQLNWSLTARLYRVSVFISVDSSVHWSCQSR